MSDIFLIDGNAIGYAAQAGSKLSVGKQQTQAIFGVIRALRGMRLAKAGAYKAVLWDGRAHWRIAAYPEYKANRDTNVVQRAMRDAYKSQKTYIEQAVTLLGIDQMKSMSCEADDLAGALAQHFSRQGHQVRLVTGDKDWLQLVNATTVWHDIRTDKLVDLSNFEEMTKLKHPYQILDQKCLMGDSSDNIKGCGGIGAVGSLQLLDVYGSVRNFLKLYDAGRLSGIPAAWTKLGSNDGGTRDRYLLNEKLMSLTGAAKPGVDERVVTKGAFDPIAFRTFAEDFAFHSILSDYDRWIAPFNKRHV